jgi:hypothetical protein
LIRYRPSSILRPVLSVIVFSFLNLNQLIISKNAGQNRKTFSVTDPARKKKAEASAPAFIFVLLPIDESFLRHCY